MISRIRVEARAETMEKARSEIEALLGHAQLAGFLEGIVPQTSKVVDDHFGAVYGNDQWHELGQSYEGRMVLKFEPEVIHGGGLKQYSYRVHQDDSDQIKDPNELPEDNGKEITDEVFVLIRQRPVTREHSWDGSSAYGYGKPMFSEDAKIVGILEDKRPLATFNRPRHGLVGIYECEVWLRGVTEGTPTNVYGTVSLKGAMSPLEDGAMATAWEYSHDLAPDEEIDKIVKDVFAKTEMYATALCNERLSTR